MLQITQETDTDVGRLFSDRNFLTNPPTVGNFQCLVFGVT